MKAILLATLLLVAFSVTAQDRRLSPWYLGIKGGTVLAGGDRAADDGRLVGLELGANLNETWALEAELFADTIEFDAGFDLDHSGFAVNLIQVNRVPLWNPYFLLGLGALRFEAPEETDTDIMGQIAVGGMWNLNNNGVMLRIEARYRYSTADSTTPGLLEDGEPVITIGLTIPFGEGK